jgi:hypothetical protein
VIEEAVVIEVGAAGVEIGGINLKFENCKM